MASLPDDSFELLKVEARRELRKGSGTLAKVFSVEEIEAKEIVWLWEGRFARGKLSLLAGDPGLGKSLMTLDLGARVSTGRIFPDGKPSSVNDVLIVSAEDAAADTIKPRLIAAGADLNRVHILDHVFGQTADGSRGARDFTLADVEALHDACDQIMQTGGRLGLVVIDPVSAYLHGTDSHKNTDVRSALRPLSDFAEDRDLAVIAVSHLNKGAQGRAVYRVTGSLAFTAAARAVWLIAEDQDDRRRRLFLPVKNNIAADTSGLAYRVETNANGQPIIHWEDGPITMGADEILNYDAGESSAGSEAEDWLIAQLETGPVASQTLKEQARDDGMSWATIRRAQKRLDVRAEKSSFNAGWVWRLPNTEESHEDAHR